eukprot:CAMPEP_0177707602 /NCGR_PEP_ID=MMETSP0484_2-20121128/9840_1 /TAXON_ID=354590 /ORGANISM="Rhodomonas lens, Strain RHODO" /LENGTH=190 /DNA_ID=CAMNT_0019219129 /DNA_START=317 /DNA_END=886 /DNA_ORIENTATION=+
MLRMAAGVEVDSLKAMKAKELKAELRERGIACDDIFDKDELVQKLAHARANNINNQSAQPSASSAQTETQTSSSSSSSAKPADPAPDTAAAAKKEAAKTDPAAKVKAEVQQMSIGEIRKELAAVGVSSHGLFEKAEFVQLLVQHRLQNPTGDEAPQGGRNPEYRDVETKKMEKKEEKEKERSNPFGGSGN